MKSIVKYILSLLSLLLVTLATQAQDFNELSVRDVNGMRSKTVSVPVYLTNTQEVIAIQFDITMPTNSQVFFDSTQVAENRRVDHVISGYSKGGNKYRFMCYSPTKQPLLGNTGRLCNIVFKVYNNLDDTKTYDITLSNIIASDINANPIEITAQNAHLTLQSYPDFEVSNLQVTNANMVPGGSMTLSWTVKNIGETASTGGWKENFYLTNESGTQVSVGPKRAESCCAGAASKSAVTHLAATASMSGKMSPSAFWWSKNTSHMLPRVPTRMSFSGRMQSFSPRPKNGVSRTCPSG